MSRKAGVQSSALPPTPCPRHTQHPGVLRTRFHWWVLLQLGPPEVLTLAGPWEPSRILLGPVPWRKRSYALGKVPSQMPQRPLQVMGIKLPDSHHLAHEAPRAENQNTLESGLQGPTPQMGAEKD